MESISNVFENRLLFLTNRAKLSRMLLFELSIKCVSALVMVCGSGIFSMEKTEA